MIDDVIADTYRQQEKRKRECVRERKRDLETNIETENIDDKS